MPVVIPLNPNDALKGLDSVNLLLSMDSDDASAGVPVSQSELRMLINGALTTLGLKIQLDASAILLVRVRIRAPQQVVGIGVSLSIRERVLVPRMFSWPPPGPIAATAPTNAWADTWSAEDTGDAGSVVNVADVREKLKSAVGRSLDAFINAWEEANQPIRQN